jgi:hypothetical protein
MSLLIFSLKHLYIALLGAVLPIIINHLIRDKSESYYFKYDKKVTINQFFGADTNSNRRQAVSDILLIERVVYGLFFLLTVVFLTFVFMLLHQELIKIGIIIDYLVFGIFIMLLFYSVKRRDSLRLKLFFAWQVIISLVLSWLIKNIFIYNYILRINDYFYSQFFYNKYGLINGFLKMLFYYGQHDQISKITWYIVTIHGIKFFTWTYILTRSLAFAFIVLIVVTMLMVAVIGLFRKETVMSARVFIPSQAILTLFIAILIFYPSITYYAWR